MTDGEIGSSNLVTLTDTQGLRAASIRGMGWIFGAGWVRSVIKLVIVALLARLLTPTDFGVLAVAAVLVGLVENGALLGFGPAIAQAEELDEHMVPTAFTLSLWCSLVIGVGVGALGPVLSNAFDIHAISRVLPVLAVVVPLHALSTVSVGLLQRSGNYRRIASGEMIGYVAGFAPVAVVGALAGLEYWALVLGHIGQGLVTLVVQFTGHPYRLRLEMNREARKRLVSYGGAWTVASIFNYVARKADNMVVAATLGPASAGAYVQAFGLMDTANSLIGNGMNTVLFPIMAKVQKQKERLLGALLDGVTLTVLLLVAPTAMLALFSGPVVRTYLGTGWTEAIPALEVLALGMIPRLLYKLAGTQTRAVGAVFGNAWRQGAFAVLVVGGALVGSRWGVRGVAWFVLGALLVHCYLMLGHALAVCGGTWSAPLHRVSSLWRVGATSIGLCILVRAVDADFALGDALSLAVVALAHVLLLALAISRRPRWLIGDDAVRVLDSVLRSVKRRQDG